MDMGDIGMYKTGMLLTPAALALEFIRAGSSQLDASWSGKRPADDEARIYCCLGGMATVDEANATWRLESGTSLLLPPGTPRSYRCSRRMELVWVHCRVTCFGGLSFFRLARLRRQLTGQHAELQAAQIKQLCELIDRQGAAAELERDGLLRLLLAPFLTEGETVPAVERFAGVLAYVEQRLAQPLTVAELASSFGTTADHFARVFRETFGEPPMAYVRRQRIARARSLLAAEPRRRLEDVAAATGFADAFHLSRVFRRLTGQSPDVWRRDRPRSIP